MRLDWIKVFGNCIAFFMKTKMGKREKCTIIKKIHTLSIFSTLNVEDGRVRGRDGVN